MATGRSGNHSETCPFEPTDGPTSDERNPATVMKNPFPGDLPPDLVPLRMREFQVIG